MTDSWRHIARPPFDPERDAAEAVEKVVDVAMAARAAGEGVVRVTVVRPDDLTVDDVLRAVAPALVGRNIMLRGGHIAFGQDESALFGFGTLRGTVREVLAEAKRRGLLG